MIDFFFIFSGNYSANISATTDSDWFDEPVQDYTSELKMLYADRAPSMGYEASCQSPTDEKYGAIEKVKKQLNFWICTNIHSISKRWLLEVTKKSHQYQNKSHLTLYTFLIKTGRQTMLGCCDLDYWSKAQIKREI